LLQAPDISHLFTTGGHLHLDREGLLAIREWHAVFCKGDTRPFFLLGASQSPFNLVTSKKILPA
jgi:hypothetical protein